MNMEAIVATCDTTITRKTSDMLFIASYYDLRDEKARSCHVEGDDKTHAEVVLRKKLDELDIPAIEIKIQKVTR